MNAPKLIAINCLLALALGSFHLKTVAQTPATAVEATPEPSAELRQALPEATYSGAGRLTIIGFDIYDSTLWITSGFSIAAYLKHPLALELAYLRSFEASAIAKRSISEMRRVGSFTDEQAERWQTVMAALFPNVKKGDKLTGVYSPTQGIRFLFNGKALAQPKELADQEFAQLFIGIWLSPKTSEPKVRALLLAKAAP